MTSFKEWLQEKTEKERNSARALRLQDWIDAYERISRQLLDWLREDGPEYITIREERIDRAEQGIGPYQLTKYRITVGDDSVDVVPIGRHVIAHVSPSGHDDYRAAGRVDVTNGFRKYSLYRIVPDGTDQWYFVDEKGATTPLSKKRLQEIIVDLMS